MQTPPPRFLSLAETTKPWWKSRTLWLNAAVLALAAAEAKLDILQPLLPVNVYALLAFALPVLNASLRFVTATAVTLRAPGTADAPPAEGGPP